jgi:hypothetical protein
VVDPKPLLGAPAIMCLRKDLARGHMRQGANEKRASTLNLRVQQLRKEVTGAIEPAPED